MKEDIIIVGAGIIGMSLALSLSRCNKKIVIIEKNLSNSLKFIELFNPKKAILTNLHSDLDYDYLKKILPKNVKPAFDGLTIDL